MLKILCLIPPHIPSYFNAGHHLPIFLVSAYLRKKFPSHLVHAYDFAALNKTWKEVCDLLMNKYDFIYTMFDYDSVDTCERFIYYVKSVSPESQLIAFGRLVKEIPGFFIKRGFNAAHYSGDYECGIETYINWYTNSSSMSNGLLLDNQDSTTYPKTQGSWLEPDNWVLPDVTEIPYSAYHHLYKNDLNKFCGIPDRQELVVPIARGCPVGCYYCDVPRMQGEKERRLSVDKTIAYIEDSFALLPFEYFTFYVPTFTLNKKWVMEFCSKLIALNKTYSWKCVTVLKTLTEELLKQMANAGCVRVSFGIESFAQDAALDLPRIKQDSLSHFKAICATAKVLGIEINVFLILGLKGDTPKQMQETISYCLEEGIRVRPTLFTPYEQLHDAMSIAEVGTFNRQLFVPDIMSLENTEGYYKLFYENRLDKATSIMNKIAVKQ